jgi:hypothetical protein
VTAEKPHDGGVNRKALKILEWWAVLLGADDSSPQMMSFLSSPPSKKVVVSLGCILWRNVFTAVFLDEEATEFFGCCSGRTRLRCRRRLGFVEPVLSGLETFQPSDGDR